MSDNNIVRLVKNELPKKEYRLLIYPDERIIPSVLDYYATYEEAYREAMECIPDESSISKPSPKKAKKLSRLEIAEICRNEDGSTTRTTLFEWHRETE